MIYKSTSSTFCFTRVKLQSSLVGAQGELGALQVDGSILELTESYLDPSVLIK